MPRLIALNGPPACGKSTLAGETTAEFHEIVLLDTKENALRRFAERTRARARRGPTSRWAVPDRFGKPTKEFSND
ncbi:hypothetical protein [Amycolatopsis speibonae]|uniref:UDP-N-acetylglucosamine kinase n=1 Tax=Amycolatopsis speibonae TaxID=1450224 RepID=A0ABV7NVZ2_9PSEU